MPSTLEEEKNPMSPAVHGSKIPLPNFNRFSDKRISQKKKGGGGGFGYARNSMNSLNTIQNQQLQ